MKKIISISSLSIITIMSFSGCSSMFSKYNQKEAYQPQNIKQLENFVDKRVEQFNKRYYQQNFIKKELANPELEMGIQTINKDNSRNYTSEIVKSDDLDITPEVNVKIIERTNVVNTKTISDNNLTSSDMNTQLEKIKILSKNDIEDTKDYSVRYKDKFPLMIGINNELLKRELNTNKDYVLTLDNNYAVAIYEKKNECSNNEVENSNLSCYLDIENYKTTPNFSSSITIYFNYKDGKIKFYNQKFNSEKNIGESLKITLKDDKTLYIKVNQ
jgi:hypothetical protein